MTNPHSLAAFVARVLSRQPEWLPGPKDGAGVAVAMSSWLKGGRPLRLNESKLVVGGAGKE